MYKPLCMIYNEGMNDLERQAIRKIASRGGKARWKNISQESRREYMRNLVKKRWKKMKTII